MLNLNRTLIIEGLKIDSFKGLNGLILDNFSDVNIFVGANNSGKQACLKH